MTPKISLVVPCFNVEAYVGAALESALIQTPCFHEIIVVDDGSTDGTAGVLSTFQASGAVKVLTTENRGLGPARNLGVEHASGEFIAFLDSDDLLASHYMGQLIEELAPDQQSLPDLLFFGGQSFQDGIEASQFSPDYTRWSLGDFESGWEAAHAMTLKHCLFPNAYLYVARRTLWDRPGVRFKPVYHEDAELILRLLSVAARTKVTDSSLYLRRIRPGSIMTEGTKPAHVHGCAAVIRATLEVWSCPPGAPHTRLTLRDHLFSSLLTYVEGLRRTGVQPNWLLLARAIARLRSAEATMRVVKTLL